MQQVAEAYLEPNRTSTMKLFLQKLLTAPLQMFAWVLNTPLQ